MSPMLNPPDIRLTDRQRLPCRPWPISHIAGEWTPGDVTIKRGHSTSTRRALADEDLRSTVNGAL